MGSASSCNNCCQEQVEVNERATISMRNPEEMVPLLIERGKKTTTTKTMKTGKENSPPPSSVSKEPKLKGDDNGDEAKEKREPLSSIQSEFQGSMQSVQEKQVISTTESSCSSKADEEGLRDYRPQAYYEEIGYADFSCLFPTAPPAGCDMEDFPYPFSPRARPRAITRDWDDEIKKEKGNFHLAPPKGPRPIMRDWDDEGKKEKY